MAAFAVVVLLGVLLPVPYRYLQPLLVAQALPALRIGARVVMYGASGLDTFSRCDQDRSSIPAMLAARLGAPVVNASWGNQTVEEAANMAGVVAPATPVEVAVVASGWLELAEADNLGAHDYMAFRMLNPSLPAAGAWSYFQQHDTVHRRPLKSFDPFVYRGVAYPGLAGLERRLFEPERSLRTCPENDGSDRTLIEAAYFHRVIEFEPRHSNARLLGALHQRLGKGGKRLLFVLLPLNLNLLQDFDPTWPGLIRSRRDAFLAVLREDGVNVLDLSEGLPNEAFTDRWCGCTHFTEAGRSMVAARIADALR